MEAKKEYAIILNVTNVKTKIDIKNYFFNLGYKIDGELFFISPHLNPVETIIDFSNYAKEEKESRKDIISAKLIRYSNEGDLLKTFKLDK